MKNLSPTTHANSFESLANLNHQTLRRAPFTFLTPLSLHTSMKVLMDTIEGSVTRGISYGLAGVKSNEKNKNNKREYEINKKRKNKNSTKSSNEQSSNKNIQKGGS